MIEHVIGSTPMAGFRGADHTAETEPRQHRGFFMNRDRPGSQVFCFQGLIVHLMLHSIIGRATHDVLLSAEDTHNP